VYLERAKKLAHKTIIERFVAVVHSKDASPTWSDVRAALLHLDRAGPLGLVQDLYTASKDNQAFLRARLGLGHDQLQAFKASISSWICPDVMKNQPISVSKAKKAIADYKKAIGPPGWDGGAVDIYCEEAFSFLESCSLEDESYFAALIRMHERSLVSNLPPAERATYLEPLDKLRSRARNIGWVFRTNSIAFGMLPLSTSTRLNDGSFWSVAQFGRAGLGERQNSAVPISLDAQLIRAQSR